MSRIVLCGYMVRYPLGGMLSNTLEYLMGLRQCGYEVTFVEKASYPSACWDPVRKEMTDDPTTGLAIVGELFTRFNIDSWCFVDVHGRAHGPAAAQYRDLLREAVATIDYGAHGTWAEESADGPVRILIDGEPGFNHIKMTRRLEAGDELPVYDRYFTNGRNVGTAASDAPTAGIDWLPVFHPVNVGLHQAPPAAPGAPFTTVMNWQSHGSIEHQGRTYGQKDVEFEHFIDLPRRCRSDLTIAVGGPHTPTVRLRECGWIVEDGHEVTRTYDSFLSFIDASAGEFTVAKNIFVALNTGWFSDRSAVYLARGRPVVMQDTGFSAHLPTGEGLFAVKNVEEAAAALEVIRSDPARHAHRAREIAVEHLDGRRVMRRMLIDAGL